MNLKKTLVALAAVATFSTAASAEQLSVAATPVPHAELLPTRPLSRGSRRRPRLRSRC